MRKTEMKLLASVAAICVALPAMAETGDAVGDDVIAAQRAALAANTDGAGFGPQAPRDIDSEGGANTLIYSEAPDREELNLCNIHFHEGAEHRGGEFTTYLGNGDGNGWNTGYGYDGELTAEELAPIDYLVGTEAHPLEPGDTIEIHYVHTSSQITPGPTLGSCLSEAIGNPQLRVEGFVYVLVNDDDAADMVELNEVGQEDGYWQAVGMPYGDAGEPVEYAGSTTGPSYNENGSPFQVSWSVHPEVIKVSISSVAAWLSDNQFDETYAHAVRNLVLNEALLSEIDD